MKKDDLISRLRALSRAEHDDLSVGAEAADEIEEQQREIERLRDKIKRLMNLLRKSDIGRF